MNKAVYDAIVVGTGPSGSTAAALLARRGYQVLALEKRRHPRYKVCGGAVSVRLDRLIGRDYHSVLEREVKNLVVTCGGGDSYTIPFDRPIAYMMMRDRFDAHLMQEARRSGCELREEEPVIQVRYDSGIAQVRTARGEYQAWTVIGADGIPSLVARRVLKRGPSPYAVGLESESVPIPNDPTIANGVLIDIGGVRGGYGWGFPKSDHLSCGVAVFRRDGQGLRHAYDRFIRSQPSFSSAGNHHTAGHLIPHFSSKAGPLVHEGAMVVGDAAGLVDPFLGEGIYYAIRSGQLAAEAVIRYLKEKIPLSTYEDAVKKEMYPEFNAASRVAWVVYHFPYLVYKLSRHKSRALVECGKILQGRSTYQDLWRACIDLRPRLRRLFR